MKNFLVSKILREIGEMLEIKGIPYKPRAYYKAARTIENLPKPIEEVNDLESLSGIGENISKKIKEIIKTGSLRYYEKLKKEMPLNFDELMNIEGMGPKKIKKLYDTLKIKTLKDLKKAAEKGLIKNIEGFGEKSEEKILKSIKLLSKTSGRILLNKALLIADDLIKKLKPYSKKITYAGSLRRMKETIGDLDLLAIPKSKRLIDEFVKEGDIIVKGPTKCSIHLPSGFHVDLRIIKEDEWGSALQYFTGSKSHNIEIRKIAIKKGYKLNEYGLFKGKNKIAGITEKSIYDKLGLIIVPPEMRENKGELLLKKLPNLVNKVYGDLQMHTIWSDGANTPEEMINKAISLGYDYVGITDHAGTLPIANAMNETRLNKQINLFKKLKNKYTQIKILHSAEVNIKEDGTLDMPNHILKNLDYVLIGIHSKFNMNEKQMTNRLIKAVSNDYVKILGHPTCRIIGQRKGINADFTKVFEECKKHKVLLEINSQPSRIDLNDNYIRQAINVGCKLIINTDSHSKEQLDFMKLGIATSKRGWAEKKDIINTLQGIAFIKRFLRSSASNI